MAQAWKKVFGTLGITAGLILIACSGGESESSEKTDRPVEEAAESATEPGTTSAEERPIGKEISFSRELGFIQIRPIGSNDGNDWSPFADARETVGIPDGFEVLLEINAGEAHDLSSLANLDPGAIEEIILEHTDVTDDQLVHVATLEKLRGINLNGCSISGEGIEHLSNLPHLEKLSLGETGITDEDLVPVAKLTKLQRLWIQRTKITDAGVAGLAGLPNLNFLILYNNEITDAGLKNLAGAPGLERLGLRGTQVTDAGLAHLSAIPSLKEVDVQETGITQAGIDEFKRGGSSIIFIR